MVKRCLILMMMVMLLAPLAGVSAQSDGEGIDYCQLVAAPDCQILVNNEAVMAELSSFAFNVDMSFRLVSESGTDESNMLLTGKGRVAADAEALDAANAMTAMSSADSDAMAAMLDSLLVGVEGEVSLLLTQTTTDKAGAEQVNRIPINLVMKDGVYTLDLAALGEESGESMAGMEGAGWLGMNLTGAAKFILADPELTPMMDMESGMMDMDYSDLGESMTITRLPDENLDGVAVAVFETSIDSNVLLDFMLASMMYGADMEMERAEMDAMMESLQGAAILVRDYIGLDDFYSRRIHVFMNADVAAADADGSSMESFSMSFTGGLDLSDFNAPVDVEMPADAVVFPYAALMRMQQRSASN